MKKISLLLIATFCFSHTYGQTSEGMKEYGKELFKHFVAHDFDWLNLQLDGKQYSKQFRQDLENTYNKQINDEENFPWLNFIVDKVVIKNVENIAFKEIQIPFYHDAQNYIWSISNIYYHPELKKYRIGVPRVSVGAQYLPLARDQKVH